MKAITLTLETQQPILATSFQGDPNSDVSYSYVPGSMIRGAVIRRYMQQNNISSLKLSDPEVKRLFFDANSTRYLNAYIVSQQGKRTLPLPLCWFKEKDVELEEKSSIKVYDFSVFEDDKLESPKRLGDYFWTNQGGIVDLYKEKRRINIHSSRDRQKGRSTKNEGEIFRYDAIDTGQTFQSVILCEDEDVTTIQDLLAEPNLWLGGSQSAGYGHTTIVDRKPPIDNWNEVYVPAEDREDEERLTITLLSDTLLRSEEGQPIANPMLIKQAIEEVLNISLPKPIDIFADSTLIGGFNRKWGLPLPQVPALAAGTTMVFEDFEIDEAQITQLEACGIGERREEGFGRIAVNLLKEKTFQASLPESSNTSSLPPLQQESSRCLAEQMAERIVRNKLENKLKEQIGYVDVKGEITNSQLSRLELVARQGLESSSRLPVFRLLRYLPYKARQQFQRTKVSEKSFDRQIYEWLKNPKSWVSNPQNLEVNVAGITKDFSHRLAIEYTLRLIMAVAKKATKEKKE